jgi:hypothetical protein
LATFLFRCNRRYLAHLSALDDITAGIKALDGLIRPPCRDGKTIKGITASGHLARPATTPLSRPSRNQKGWAQDSP